MQLERLADAFDATDSNKFFNEIAMMTRLYRDIGAVRCQYACERTLETVL